MAELPHRAHGARPDVLLDAESPQRGVHRAGSPEPHDVFDGALALRDLKEERVDSRVRVRSDEDAAPCGNDAAHDEGDRRRLAAARHAKNARKVACAKAAINGGALVSIEAALKSAHVSTCFFDSAGRNFYAFLEEVEKFIIGQRNLKLREVVKTN